MADPKNLEEGFKEIGNRLTSPPSDVDDLLSLLDQTKNLLARVEQWPPESLLTALRPAMLALVAKELLEHSHADVKVSVASCLSEITQITAPDPPYPNDLMKGVFEAIVDAFGGLDDVSNCSFSKRVSILESVANVRLCLVLLDQDCDDLILQMFQHFLKTIRLNHPENVFSWMKTIMTDVIEESDNISESLLLCLLRPLNKENKDVLPIACKLAEEVVNKCKVKLKPIACKLTEEVVNKCKVKLKSSLDDISSLSAPLIEHSKVPVPASICQLNSDATEQREQYAFGGCWISEAEKEKGDLNQNLTGSKIKVWWPDDKRFYEGVVDSFDPVTQKHKILYHSGDVETLLLKEELWVPVNNDREIDERQAELPDHAAASNLIHLANSKRMIEDEDWKRLNEIISFIPSEKVKSAPNSWKRCSKEPLKKKIKCVETMQQTSPVSGQIEETPLPNASLSLEDGVAKVSSKSQMREEKQINGISSLENIVEKKKSLSASPCQLQLSVPPVASEISMIPTPATSRGALLLQKFIRPVSSPLSELPSHNRANSGPSKVELYNTQALAEVKKLFAHFQNGDFSGSEIPYELPLDDGKIEVSEPARTIFPKFFEIYPQMPTFALEPRASHKQKIETWVSVVGLFTQVCQDAQNNVLSSSYVELEKEIQELVDIGFNLQPLQYVIELITNGQKRADHFARRMKFIGKLISTEEARVKELFSLENKQKELDHSLLEAAEGLKADEEKLEVLIVELNDKIAKRKGEIEIIKKELQNVDELRRGNMLHSGDSAYLKQLKEGYRSMENELAVFGNFLEDTGILKLTAASVSRVDKDK